MAHGFSRALARTALRTQCLHHLVGIEALADEIAEESLELAIVGDGVSPAQPFPQRCFEERVAIDPLEYFVDGLPRGVLRNPGAFELESHPGLTALPDACFRSRDSFSNALIVDCPLLAQPGHGLVDLILGIGFSREALTHLTLGQLAASQHLQPVEIRGHQGGQLNDQFLNRVISGAGGGFLAI